MMISESYHVMRSKQGDSVYLSLFNETFTDWAVFRYSGNGTRLIESLDSDSTMFWRSLMVKWHSNGTLDRILA